MTPRRKTPAPSPGESALGPATVFDWLHAVAAGNYRQTPGIVDGQPRLTPEDYRRLAYRDPARGYPHPGLQNNRISTCCANGCEARWGRTWTTLRYSH